MIFRGRNCFATALQKDRILAESTMRSTVAAGNGMSEQLFACSDGKPRLHEKIGATLVTTRRAGQAPDRLRLLSTPNYFLGHVLNLITAKFRSCGRRIETHHLAVGSQ